MSYMKREMNFAKALKAHRTERRLTQEQLATLSGVIVSLLSRYENGRVSPSLETVEKIARALRVPAGELLKAG